MKEKELQEIRERFEHYVSSFGFLPPEFVREMVTNFLKLLDEIERLQNIIRTYRLNEYRWQCSGCGHFQKYHNSRYRCENCKRENYLSGSFKWEDLEKWFDERQALGDES